MILTFGKFKGDHVSEVPSSYLFWLLENCNLQPWLEESIRRELARRFAAPAPRAPAAITLTDLESRVTGWYRRQSLRWHPDRGGSDAAMAAVNDGYEELCEALGLRR